MKSLDEKMDDLINKYQGFVQSVWISSVEYALIKSKPHIFDDISIKFGSLPVAWYEFFEFIRSSDAEQEKLLSYKDNGILSESQFTALYNDLDRVRKLSFQKFKELIPYLFIELSKREPIFVKTPTQLARTELILNDFINLIINDTLNREENINAANIYSLLGEYQVLLSPFKHYLVNSRQGVGNKSMPNVEVIVSDNTIAAIREKAERISVRKRNLFILACLQYLQLKDIINLSDFKNNTPRFLDFLSLKFNGGVSTFRHVYTKFSSKYGLIGQDYDEPKKTALLGLLTTDFEAVITLI